MVHSRRILVIVSSVRARRICPQIAAWVAEVGRASMAGEFELVDLKDWPLLMDDEPGVPATGEYFHNHTRAWSRKVSGGDAFVFVTPQYNWGYPAPLKNALDHLYKEWAEKPAAIVAYGGHGGDKCAEQLRQVLLGLHMKPIVTSTGLKLDRKRIEANTGLIDPAAEFSAQLETLRGTFHELDAALAKV